MLIQENVPEKKSWHEQYYYYIAAAIAVGAAIILYFYAPVAVDWRLTFYPASGAWLAPYSGDFHFAYPPWMAAILAPFHFLERQLAYAIFQGATIFICAYCNRVLKGDFFSFLLFITSIPIWALIRFGQVDGIVILGLALLLTQSEFLPILGLPLILTKPQLFIFMLPLLCLFSDHCKKLIISGTLFLLLSVLVWGWWVFPMLDMVKELFAPVNIAPWPYGIPFGLFLLYWGYRNEEPVYGALATFFFTPYIAVYSITGYVLILYAKLPRQWSLIVYLILTILGGAYVLFMFDIF